MRSIKQGARTIKVPIRIMLKSLSDSGGTNIVAISAELNKKKK